MNKFLTHWFSFGLMAVWIIICIICQKTDVASYFANRGIAVIGSQYYRFVTSLFVHTNFLHLLANVSALYFLGKYLEPQITPVKLLAFSLLIGVVTEALFSVVYRNAVSFGGSPILFALIGLIIALKIMQADVFQFKLGTWNGNWIVGYAILANIPIFSDNFVSTLFVHGIPTVLGILLGCLCIGLKLI